MSVIAAAEFESLPALLARRARMPAERWRLRFLDGAGEGRSIDLPGFAARVATVARHLSSMVAKGEPVLLFYPPGIDFLIGFMACLAAGNPAVPLNPPRRNRLIERVDGVIADAGLRVALTTGAMLSDQIWWRDGDHPLARLVWVETDRIALAGDARAIPAGPEDVAYIQYTSGSTSAPKGVVVTHGNLIEDLRRIQAVWGIGPDSVMVTWLPAFHDLGLIYGLLQPLFSGCATIAMAPAHFLQAPVSWLAAITRYRGTHTAAPSFAYDSCVRRISDAECAMLDLSSLRVAMNAAEPIDPAVMAAFQHRFGPCGYGADVSSPAYGLAESTLVITANPAGVRHVVRHVDVDALEQHGRAVLLPAGTPGGRAIVGCGQRLPGIGIAIVDPQTARPLPDGAVGEIWASGPTIAAGYRNNSQASAETFGARLPGAGDTRHLRTGDLGFLHDGELFVTGRLKDLIIIRGVNHYPQDIERAVFRSHPGLRPECGAAFALPATEGGAERLAIVQEVERVHRKAPPKPIFDAIRDAVWQGFDLVAHSITLIEPGSVPRTSSGKIRRRACRTALLDGSLPVVAAWQLAEPSPAPSTAPAVLRDPATLRAWLLTWLADQLGAPAERIDPDESFAAYGLDSVAATRLAAQLGAWLGTALPQTVVWDHPSPNCLLRHLQASPRPAAPAAQPPVRTGGDLLELLDAIERS